MHFQSLLAFAAGISAVAAHGVILAAQGDDGSIASQGFLVNASVARNCTTISPCQQDSTIIRDEEINQNIVNNCGRTELTGNIDVGEQTENELAANRVTSVKKGSTLAVTIHQVNADGAGPYECDLDQTSNAGTNLQNLSVTNNVPGANGLSQAKFQDFTINVKLPDDLDCTGASTGNVCTVRCRNNALAGPFGGCFAVQQTDGGGRGANESASTITTSQTLDAISKQILVNNEDFETAVKANQDAGAANGDAGAAAISALATDVASSTAAAAASATAESNNNNNNGNNKNSNNDNNDNNDNNNDKKKRRRALSFMS